MKSACVEQVWLLCAHLLLLLLLLVVHAMLLLHLRRHAALVVVVHPWLTVLLLLLLVVVTLYRTSKAKYTSEGSISMVTERQVLGTGCWGMESTRDRRWVVVKYYLKLNAPPF